MIKNTLSLVLCLLITLCSCNSKDQEDKSSKTERKENFATSTTVDIDYVDLKNYFVKNNANQQGELKIETKEEFDAIFGTATTMDNSQKPILLDFDKQYVLAVIFNKTDLDTQLDVIGLQQNSNNNKINMTYKISQGEKQTYSIVPYAAIAIDKNINGFVKYTIVK